GSAIVDPVGGVSAQALDTDLMRGYSKPFAERLCDELNTAFLVRHYPPIFSDDAVRPALISPARQPGCPSSRQRIYFAIKLTPCQFASELVLDGIRSISYTVSNEIERPGHNPSHDPTARHPMKLTPVEKKRWELWGISLFLLLTSAATVIVFSLITQ